MLAVCQPQQEPGTETADNMTQCEQVPMEERETQTDNVQVCMLETFTSLVDCPDHLIKCCFVTAFAWTKRTGR